VADNVTLSAGDNPTIDTATDEIAGVHYQKIKLFDPTADSTAGIGVSANPLHVQAASLPIPTGASTAANQTTIIGHVDGIEAAFTTLNAKDFATQTTLAVLNAKVTACDTGSVVVSSSALPSGASTASNQTTIIGHVDGIETALATLNAKDFATQTTLATLNTKVTACNTGAVVVSSSALPSGASTSALQTTGNASLSSIDGKITACNTGAVAGTVTANQGAPLVSGTGWRVTEYGTAGLPGFYFNIFGLFELPTVIVGDPNTGSPWAFISNRGLIQFKSTAVARLVVAASVGSVNLLPAQPLRSGATIFNNSTAILYIKYGATASLSSWDDKLFPNQKLEVPFGTDTIIDGIWDAAVGDAHVTEFY
jgi:hypothetical protein